MRKFLLGIIAACALFNANAEAMQWDGLYGGLQARYAWTKTDIDIPAYHQPPFEIDTEGASYGAFIGARWRLDARWSAGVEIEATWYNERERSPTGREGELYILEHSWAASARALAAYDVNDETRIYAAAGIAFTEAAAAYAPSARRADEEPLTGWDARSGPRARLLRSPLLARGGALHSLRGWRIRPSHPVHH